MGKLHKTLRVEEETAARVEALKAEGESEAATYTRVILAGLDTLEATGSGEEAAKSDREAPEGGDQGALVRSLTEHIDTLKAANEELSGQLRVKDSQIEALTAITQAAQALDGYGRKQLAEPSEADVIEVPEEAGTANEQRNESQEEPKRRGLFSRLFG